LLLAQDVTEMRRLERVRQDFVANVSHELKTPLTVLSGFIENLEHEESECSQRWQRPLNLMSQQSHRMLGIVNDLLLLAKLESATPYLTEREMLDVAALLRGIAEEAVMPSPEQVPKISLSLDERIRLSGNEVELRSAFFNLILNAIKYTSSDGHVSINCYRDQDGTCCVEIKDTGEGIADEHIPRLTERFYRVDVGRSRKRGGTGLGLAIVKHVMQHHQAKLEVESRLGEGSCFRCRFPADQVAMLDDDLQEDADG
jgi:two-component system phosphate regulon sensor histidine kinase PhoR